MANNIRKIAPLDSLTQYLSEIREYPLLTKEKELELLEIIKQGGTRAEEAKELFINSNLKLVVHIAKQYMKKGLELLDLIGYGNIALMDALESFDVTKENRFSTYAEICIKQHIELAISDYSSTIRIPIRARKRYEKYLKVKQELEDELGRVPSPEEIATAMNVSPQIILNMKNNVYSPARSLDTPINGESENRLGDFIPLDSLTPEDKIISKQFIIEFKNFLISLKSREADMLLRNLGLYDGRVYTYAELANIYGITKQRISKILIPFIANLKKWIYENKVFEYYNISTGKERKTIRNWATELGCTPEQIEYVLSQLSITDKVAIRVQDQLNSSLSREVNRIISKIKEKIKRMCFEQANFYIDNQHDIDSPTSEETEDILEKIENIYNSLAKAKEGKSIINLLICQIDKKLEESELCIPQECGDINLIKFTIIYLLSEGYTEEDILAIMGLTQDNNVARAIISKIKELIKTNNCINMNNSSSFTDLKSSL